MASESDRSNNAPPGPLSRTEWVVERLRSAIMAGELPADEPLRARDVAVQWSVSETPVREAFQRLAADGFLIHTTHRGVRVAPISAGELTELYSLRVVLEPMALGRSLARADDAWLRQIEAAYAEMTARAETAATERAAFENAHRAWHYALISASGDSWWPRTVRLLRDQCERYWVKSLVPRDIEEVSREHAAIQDACLGARVHEATRLLADHIAASEAGVRQQLGVD